MLWICYVVLLLLDLDFQTWTFETQSFRPCIPMSNLINRCFVPCLHMHHFYGIAIVAPETSCVAPIVCFVCERLSFGAMMSRILLILAVIWQKHMCSKQPHSGMSMGKFWEATVILEKLLLCNKIWWDVSILSNTMRFGNYSCFFF